MAGSKLGRGDWSIVRTRGDAMTPERFAITIDGAPMVVAGSRAQIRDRGTRDATLVATLTTSQTGNQVTVGAGDTLDYPSRVYWWDLEVWDDASYTSAAPLTIVGGKFQLLEDVTNV